MCGIGNRGLWIEVEASDEAVTEIKIAAANEGHPFFAGFFSIRRSPPLIQSDCDLFC